MSDLKQLVEKYKETIINYRRTLHKIPETAYTEQKTSTFVAEQLEQLGLDVKTGIARYGVVGLMPSGKEGKTVMVRSDMDALPIKEETGLPFASTHPGNMHACGHDGHMAMVLGAALVMNELKEKLKGQVKFLFQPAEEAEGGAKPMIEEGVMENPHVDFSIGAHLWPTVPEGKIGVKAGPLMAAMDRFELKIIGKGGHGAMPQMCVDPIDVGIQVVNALQRVVSRQMNPLTPTVVTIGSFQAGTTFNIIPDTVVLRGTTRTFDRAIWGEWPERLGKIISGVCSSMGASYELDFMKGNPPTVNNAEIAEVAWQVAEKVVGKDNVVVPEMTMGGEDMSYFLEESKGCYIFVGIGREGGYPLHNSRFDYSEDVLLSGVETHCRMIFELLS